MSYIAIPKCFLSNSVEVYLKCYLHLSETEQPKVRSNIATETAHQKAKPFMMVRGT